MQKVLVLGLGISGKAVCEYLLGRGCLVTACDDRLSFSDPNVQSLLQKGCLFLSTQEILNGAFNYDLFVPSPGISREHSIYLIALEKNVNIQSEVSIALESGIYWETLFGVTGTNGKTTVCLLLKHIFQHLGKPVRALGNIGTPCLSQKKQRRGALSIIELSSFQLETFQSKVLDAAAILNISPDHLDRHKTMQSYARVKCSIGNCLKTGRPLYVHSEVLKEYKAYLNYEKIITFGNNEGNLWIDKNYILYNDKVECIFPQSALIKLEEKRENILAAYAFCRGVGVLGEDFVSAVLSFKAPEHRLEYVASIKNVIFYNDSKGTNVDAVRWALNKLHRPLHLIVGGVDKGASYKPWKKAFENKVKSVVAMGSASHKIREDLKGKIEVDIVSDLQNAVLKTWQYAKAGDAIVLSPGCASFDMFRNYQHRGQEFKKLVWELKIKEASL